MFFSVEAILGTVRSAASAGETSARRVFGNNNEKLYVILTVKGAVSCGDGEFDSDGRGVC